MTLSSQSFSDEPFTVIFENHTLPLDYLSKVCIRLSRVSQVVSALAEPHLEQEGLVCIEMHPWRTDWPINPLVGQNLDLPIIEMSLCIADSPWWVGGGCTGFYQIDRLNVADVD